MTVEVDLTALHSLWGKTPHMAPGSPVDGPERSGLVAREDHQSCSPMQPGRYKITSRAKNSPGDALEATQCDLFQDERSGCKDEHQGWFSPATNPWEDCPWGDEPASANIAYQKRIRQCFADAYTFLDDNKHIRDGEGWRRATEGMRRYKDPLTVELVLAAMNELEREYKENVI